MTGTADDRHLKNIYTPGEWAGAFGDLGTLIPFVVAYISVMKLDPAGILFAFALSKIAVGLFYRVPMPVQPMKAIGAAAVSQAATTPAMVSGAGLVTGLLWLVLGLTGAIKLVTRIATRPVVLGIVLGLGLSFVVQGVHMISSAPWVGWIAFAFTLLLFAQPWIPAMFGLLILGAVVALWQTPNLTVELARMAPHLHLPEVSLSQLSWQGVISGALVLAIPQLPLTLGNAIIATTAETNELFPHHPVSERQLALSTGMMNLFSFLIGGVPLCHGAGGMAGHVRFGARTGGALVILGSLLLVLALFFSDSVGVIFSIFPTAVLGVILFFAGAELALTARDASLERKDFYVMVITAGLAMWNMLAAFVVGISLYHLLQRRLLKV